MGALTKQERDALEEIFLSLGQSDDKYSKLKKYIPLNISKNISFHASRLVQMAKVEIKESKISQLTTLFDKKKKNLSK